MADEEWKGLFNLQEGLYDDINDYIDENVFVENSTVDDIDKSVVRVEDLRSKYRGFHKELRCLNNKKYEAEMKEEFEKCLQSIKEYLKTIKSVKTEIRSVASTDQSQLEFLQKEKAVLHRSSKP